MTLPNRPLFPRRWFLLLLLLFGASSLFAQAEKIRPELVTTIQAQPDSWLAVDILLTAQVDIPTLKARHDAKNAPVPERAREVIEALQAQATVTQAGLMAWVT
ncbi:MAG: hypothetical protein D6722_07940, partial [Bacteroidetes bacterium]